MERKCVKPERLFVFIVWCLTLFSTIFQLYRGGQCTYPGFPGYFFNFARKELRYGYSVCLFISVYLSSLPVSHQSDAPRNRLVVTEDSARLQNESTQSPAWFFNPFPNKRWFLRVCSTKLLKTLRKKKKLLLTSNFSFSRFVFYPFRDLSTIFIKLRIVVRKLFQF